MSADWALLTPEIILVGAALAVWSLDLVLPDQRKGLLSYLAALALLAVAVAAATQAGLSAHLFGGLLRIDSYSVLFRVLFPVIGIVVCLASTDYVRRRLTHPGEYYGIIMTSVLAMMAMSAAGELLTAYISLELMSFTFYVLASYARHDLKSNEAGVKYVLLGALSSAVLLYGISLLYGATGTTTFPGLADAVRQGSALPTVFGLGLALVLAGFGFKVAAVPFHMWSPDVYEGAPAPVTAFLSVASKTAAFVLLLRLVTVGFMPAAAEWRPLLAALAVVSMVVGNLVALAQNNIKRLIAYSSIGHAGYLLLGFAALAPGATLVSNGILFHLVGYAASNLAAFLVVIAVAAATGKEELADYDGLAERAPLMALTLAVAFFSSAGLPFFVGFTTKFYLFTAVVQSAPALIWLVGLAMVMSLVSLYYYLVVIKRMYIHAVEGRERVGAPVALSGLLVLLVVVIVALGIYPEPLLNLIQSASRALFA
ncbi:MAG: NADH-quinone oxidoreductase subunit N [Dehalococcoidia bacterium]|nr:NADH-quinone oxidoreductase subunit N [Dehalococcoidia bacterium]